MSFTTGFGGFSDGYQFALTFMLPLFVAIALFFLDRASQYLLLSLFTFEKKSSILFFISFVQIFMVNLIYISLNFFSTL